MKTSIGIPLLFFLFIPFIGCGGGSGGGEAVGPTTSVVLAWEAPVTNEDGTPLVDLAGYRVYYGKESAAYSSVVDVGSLPSCSIGDLGVGNWFFAVTAYDTSGNESGFSDEVSVLITEDDLT